MIPNTLFVRLSRFLWTVVLLGAGTAHFVVPSWFTAYYPSYLPWSQTAVLLSGVVEWLLAAMLWNKRLQSHAWFAITMLMVVYVPVHVYVITHHDAVEHPFIAIPLWLAWMRLPIQGLLIWWAWRMRQATARPS
jgi:uncharacterized membrane protein